MNKYILTYSWFLPKTFHLLDYTTSEEILKCTNEEIKQVPSLEFSIKPEKDTKTTDYRKAIYKDDSLNFIVEEILETKKNNILLNDVTYIATNIDSSKELFKMTYMGHNKWQIETDYSDLKKLLIMCSKIFLTFHNMHAFENTSNMAI